MLFVVLCPGTPEGSTGSGSGFKASQKTGQRLKVSSDRLGKAGNRTCDPGLSLGLEIIIEVSKISLYMEEDIKYITHKMTIFSVFLLNICFGG